MSIGAHRFDNADRIADRRESLDEQARRRGIRPVVDVSDMVDLTIIDTDEELDAFLAHVYAERHANLA